MPRETEESRQMNTANGLVNRQYRVERMLEAIKCFANHLHRELRERVKETNVSINLCVCPLRLFACVDVFPLHF